MKKISNFIQEKLKINSKSNIIESRGILDEKIESLKDLIPICKDYFEQFHKIEISKIYSSEQGWKMPNSKSSIIVKDHFEIKFLNITNRCIKKLRFGNWGKNNILMQVLVLSSTGKSFEPCRIHGGSVIDEFKRGDNFLDFILNIKKQTELNKTAKDINLMQLFKDLYEINN